MIIEQYTQFWKGYIVHVNNICYPKPFQYVAYYQRDELSPRVPFTPIPSPTTHTTTTTTEKRAKRKRLS